MKKLIFFLAIILAILLGGLIYLNQNYGFFIYSDTNSQETYVSLRFDDGLISQKAAFDLLKKYNMTGSSYIITTKPASEIEWEKKYYLDWNQIKEISSFIEIGSHTLTHQDLTKTSDYRSEIVLSKATLENQGYKVSTFVYPAGIYNYFVIKEVEKNYECASTQDVGVNDLKINKPVLLKDFTVRDYNSLEQVKNVIKKGSWTILTFHDIGEISLDLPETYSKVAKGNSISLELFEDILKYLKNNNIKVITIADGCQKFKND